MESIGGRTCGCRCALIGDLGLGNCWNSLRGFDEISRGADNKTETIKESLEEGKSFRDVFFFNVLTANAPRISFACRQNGELPVPLTIHSIHLEAFFGGSKVCDT